VELVKQFFHVARHGFLSRGLGGISLSARQTSHKGRELLFKISDEEFGRYSE
jgi:hypothetical protein